MQHWRRANCSVHVALCITAPLQLYFALCKLRYMYCTELLVISNLSCASYLSVYCTAALMTNLYCANYIEGNAVQQFVVCQLYYVVLQCSCGDFQFALCKLYVGTALQKRRNSISDMQVIIMWFCRAASVTCNLQCGSSIIRYCSAALTTCNLHCAVVLFGISVMHRRFAVFTVQNTLYGIAV
jgi:hypothetical protein